MSAPHQPFVQYVTAEVLAKCDTRCDGCDGHTDLRGYRMMRTPHSFEFLCSNCRAEGLRPPVDEYFATFNVDVVLGITKLPEGDPYHV
jgi:hypothetical protein